MQRLFSTFADGSPGGGLLLLRLLAGGGLIYSGIAAVRTSSDLPHPIMQLVCAAAGVLILGGLWAPWREDWQEF